MSYIGISPSTAAFPFDQFSGNGTTTAFTMSYAPASTTSMVVCISGVVQNPNTYSITGLTLTFSAAPPTGTNNIGVLYLGIPATSVSTPGNTAYLSSTQFTATAGQTTFTPSGTYQTGFVNVIRNGSQLAPSDYTATNGTTVVLANACVAGDVVVVEVYNLVSVSNALPLTGGTVTGATTFNSSVTINGASSSGYTGYKNRIINGGMVIDQRNNGASIVPNAAGVFPVDRFIVRQNTDGSATTQRSTTAPSNFINSILYTVTGTDTSLAATQFVDIQQRIEGLNVADLGWGTASAATITISFWVRSSVTGTFVVCPQNSAFNRCYPATYTINSANTWEQKTITIPGDTSGTWLTDNNVGIYLSFTLASGSTYQGTANTWNAAGVISTASAINFMATNGATFYVTGVQLERGSNATSFEFRDYGRELMMCQRYYVQYTAAASNWVNFNGFAYSATAAVATISVVPLRTAPTVALSGSGTLAFNDGAANYTVTSPALRTPIYTYENSISIAFTATSLVAYRSGGFFNTNGTNPISLTISAEL